MEQSLQNRVITLVGKTLNRDATNIQLSDILEDLAEDSIALFSLITAVEEEFAIETEYDEVVEIVTVEDVVEYLKKKKVQ